MVIAVIPSFDISELTTGCRRRGSADTCGGRVHVKPSSHGTFSRLSDQTPSAGFYLCFNTQNGEAQFVKKWPEITGETSFLQIEMGLWRSNEDTHIVSPHGTENLSLRDFMADGKVWPSAVLWFYGFIWIKRETWDTQMNSALSLAPAVTGSYFMIVFYIILVMSLMSTGSVSAAVSLLMMFYFSFLCFGFFAEASRSVVTKTLRTSLLIFSFVEFPGINLVFLLGLTWWPQVLSLQ